MTDVLLRHEIALRLTIFLGMLTAMALWELASPQRRQDIPRLLRWGNNLAMVVVDTVAVRLVFPLAAVGIAAWAETAGWGLFALTGGPEWLRVVAAMLVLDLAIYGQHVMFHAVPWLWRLHRMHHSDPACDASTGLRFHPVEIVLSMAIKIAVIVAIGAPPLAVLLFEVILNGASIFNHANIRLPARVDRVLRWVVVTPDMHRIHHSERKEETNSNYGFSVPWWDRLLGTYRAAPKDGQLGMILGIGRFGTVRDQWLDRLLWQPLRGKGR